MTTIRHIYDGKQDEVSQLTGLDCSKDGKGRTKQSAAAECDINQITKRYERTGVLPDLIKTNPQYGDFSAVPDYMEAMTIVSLAEEQFSALDAHVRARFGNDPANFLEFATNQANMGELVKMGLAVEKQPDPTPSPAAPAVAPGAPGKGA
jgi:phage internal scaffolding protein